MDALHKAEPLATNHKRIWLQPICCVDERCWSEDPQPCDDCDLPSVKYIRADLVTDLITAALAACETGDRHKLPALREALAALTSQPEVGKP